MRILLIFTAIFLSFIGTANASETRPYKSGRATAQLVSSYDQAHAGETIHVALSLRLEPHWHTYWRNAGGPGNGVRINWTLPESALMGPPTWPLPMLVKTGPIVNYAYEDKMLLPHAFTLPTNVRDGDEIIIEMEALYLVCYKVCLPETARLSLPITIGPPIKDARWASNIRRGIGKSPQENPAYKAAVRMDSGRLAANFTGPELTNISSPYFFPYIQDQINADAAQVVTVGSKGLRIDMEPSFELENGITGPLDGMLAFNQETENGTVRRGVIVRATQGQLDIGAPDFTPSATSGNSIGLFTALIGAFIGGLILNLMPCVFPILSLKALGFAKAAHDERGKIRTHGWLFTAGVMVSFLVLAGTLVILKQSGAGLGWGFQLQNPVVVGALALLFFIIALNLFGLFDIGGSVQNTGAKLANAGGAKGAFFTGVLAVIVAAPCTAPFMAGAIGYAFAQPAMITLLVFTALGAGFALPFLALSHAPRLLARLPKPGAWMETCKQFMAFPMLATAIWLVWVLSAQSGADGTGLILVAMLLTGFAIWLVKKPSGLRKLLTALSIAAAIFCIANIKTMPSEPTGESAQAQKWSQARVTELRAQGHNVFVDFTAKWCATCKVNEARALNTQAGRDLFTETNTVMLIADWTNPDPLIAAELAKFGRAGVPLYLLYGPNTETPQVLSERLSVKKLKKALDNLKP